VPRIIIRASTVDAFSLSSTANTGTPYDLTQGLEAGPYGDPSRWDNALNDNMTRVELLSGGFERCVLYASLMCCRVLVASCVVLLGCGYSFETGMYVS
jgi:hypothetical protein